MTVSDEAELERIAEQYASEGWQATMRDVEYGTAAATARAPYGAPRRCPRNFGDVVHPPAHGTALWSSPEWRADAVRWLDERLAAAGLVRLGDVEQPHLRPWATVLRAPTNEGPVWFKAAGPGTAFEVGLYELLARLAPERVLTPIATDRTGGGSCCRTAGHPRAIAWPAPAWRRPWSPPPCSTASCS